MRKPITPESINADIKDYGGAVRSLTPEQYEELEQAYDVKLTNDPILQNGRRMCRITPKQN